MYPSKMKALEQIAQGITIKSSSGISTETNNKNSQVSANSLDQTVVE